MPPPGATGLDANEGSVGFLLDAGSFRYLNTGDAGREVEERILEMVAQNLALTRVMFPAGVKSVRGYELDRVYVRGGVVTDHTPSAPLRHSAT